MSSISVFDLIQQLQFKLLSYSDRKRLRAFNKFRLYEYVLLQDLASTRERRNPSDSLYEIAGIVYDLRRCGLRDEAGHLQELVDRLDTSGRPVLLSVLVFLLSLRSLQRSTDKSSTGLLNSKCDYLHRGGITPGYGPLLSARMLKMRSPSELSIPSFIVPRAGSSDSLHQYRLSLHSRKGPVRQLSRDPDEGFVDDQSSANDGFRSMSNSLLQDDVPSGQVWTELVNAERDGSLQLQNRRSGHYLSESGDDGFTQFYEANFVRPLRHLSASPPDGMEDEVASILIRVRFVDEIRRSILQMMAGIDCRLFAWSEADECYRITKLIYDVGVTCESTTSCLSYFVDAATRLKLSRAQLLNAGGTKSQIMRAYISGVSAILRKLEMRLCLAVEERTGSLVTLKPACQPYVDTIVFICKLNSVLLGNDAGEASSLQGVTLLNNLYQICCHCHAASCRPVLLYLLEQCIDAYSRYLDSWLTRGSVNDITGEFMIIANPDCISMRNRRFWTDAFILSESGSMDRVPSPLRPFASQILSSGRSMNLLRSCCAQQLRVNNGDSVVDQANQVTHCYDKPIFRPPDSIKAFGSLSGAASDEMLLDDPVFGFRGSRIASFESGPASVIMTDETPVEVAVASFYADWIAVRTLNVTKEAKQYFLAELRLMSTLELLKNIYMCGYGTFANELIRRLFETIHPVADNALLIVQPRISGEVPASRGDIIRRSASLEPTVHVLLGSVFPNPLAINVLLEESLHCCSELGDDAVNDFSFSLTDSNYENISIDLISPNIINFLKLCYSVPWPINIIITDDALSSYDRIFGFLMSLHWISRSLKDTFSIISGLASSDDVTVPRHMVLRFNVLRHEMEFFLYVLYGYICHQLVDISWTEFGYDMKHRTQSVDDIYTCFMNYLRRCEHRCLLDASTDYIRSVIHDLLSLILRFRQSLVKARHRQDDPAVWIRLFKSTEKRHAIFRDKIKFLRNVIQNILSTSGQSHLSELLLRLNFNGYYG